MRVLAVDPGGTTGLAFYSGADDYFHSWQMTGFDEVVREIPGWQPDVIVCESFTIRSNTHKLDAGAFSHTTDLIGACRLIALRDGAEFVRQSPAQAKGFATDAKLRTLRWYSTIKGGHSNDASRHLLTYLAGIRYAPILEQLTKETEA